MDIKGRIPDPEVAGNWIEGAIEGWVVTSVEGSAAVPDAQAQAEEAVDMDAVLLELADGRTEADFVQEAMKDARIKAAPEVLDTIFQQNAGILHLFIEDGRLEVDGDVFKVPAEKEVTTS